MIYPRLKSSATACGFASDAWHGNWTQITSVDRNSIEIYTASVNEKAHERSCSAETNYSCRPLTPPAMQISNSRTHSFKMTVTRSTRPSSDASWSSIATMLNCFTVPHSLIRRATDFTREKTSQHRESWHGLQTIAKYYLIVASELDTFRCLKNHSKRTLSTFHSLFSYFGAKATSFLMKTFYCDTEDVIHDIVRLTMHPMDHQTAESDTIVYETTYNWCCVQEKGRYWCMWRAEKVGVSKFWGFKFLKIERMSYRVWDHMTLTAVITAIILLIYFCRGRSW